MPRHRSNEAQIARCIALLLALANARRGVKVGPFYKDRGWNPRSAYRDVETLQAAGVPVEKPEHGWYRLGANWIPPGAVDVKPDERFALHVVRDLAPGLRETTIGRALRSLWSKLAAPNRQVSLPLGDEASFRCSASASIDLGPHCMVIDTALEAIRAQRTLRICYRKSSGDESERVIEPSLLDWCPTAEALYLRAYCRKRAAFRTFAIHRVASIELLEEPFARRPDPERESGHGFRMWHGSSVEHVSILFSPGVAGEIRERRWHASQRLTPTADGGVVLDMDVTAFGELERWLLGWGADAEVLAPASLAERIRRRHAEAAGLHLGPLRAARPGGSRGGAAGSQSGLQAG